LKFRTTWVVLVLVIALGGYVYLHEVRGGRQRSERNAAAAKLLGIDPAQVTRLHITHSGTQHDLQRRGGAWYLVRPIAAPVDSHTMAAFLDTLATARREDDVGRGNLPRYGLDAPSALVEIEVGGETRRLQFGRINPQQTLVYALVDDSKDVVLTTSSLLTQSLANTFGWRDKRMIDVDPAAVQRLAFNTPLDGGLAIRREPGQLWYVEGETPWRVDPVRAESMLLGFAALQAVGVAAENRADEGRFGLGNQRFRVELATSSGEPLGRTWFGLADGKGAYFGAVADKPEVFLVDAKLVDAMVALVREPRDRRAFPPFDPENVDRMQVVGTEDRFELRRRSAHDWKVVSSTRYDSTFAIGPGTVDAVLTELATLELSAFPAQQPPAALYDPARISLRLFAGPREVSGLDLGRREPGGGLNIVSRGPGEPAVFLLSPSALLKIPFDLERLKADEEPAPPDADRG
jgi:hypothetical protein